MNEAQPTPEPAPTVLGTVIGETVPERVGSVIGPYKLLQQIGEGGFGVVYMAEQEQPVRRRVALKIIKPGMDTAQVIARFESERQALALMDHPNIARVIDAGATSSGHPYFVMELVKGVPITAFCDQHHLPPEARLKLFLDVCHAIQHAHHKGIIHRDIKPSNVMVTEHDGAPVVKVIDFGVAKATVQKLTERTLFTAYGQMLGTPAYMSPEQAAMSGVDIDTRSDVYSLGVLLYELLTGTTPLESERLRAAAYAEMQRLIREEEPQRPSARLSSLGDTASVLADNRGLDLKHLTQLLASDLDWVVMKALEKDRNRRYDTPANFAQDIERYLSHEAVMARPPSRAYRLKKFAQRNRGAVLTAAAVALALLAGTGVSTWQAMRATRAEKLEIESGRRLDAKNHELEAANLELAQARDRAERRVDLALEAVQSFRAAVDSNLDVRNRPENSLLRKTLLQSPLAFYKRLRDDLRDGHESRPEARAQLGDAYYRLADLTGDIGSLTDALASADESVALWEPLAKEAPEPLRTSARQKLAAALYRRGELQGASKGLADAAMDSFNRARALLEALIQERAADLDLRVTLARVLTSTGFAQSRKGHADAALATLRAGPSVLEEARRLAPGNLDVELQLAQTHQQVGSVLLNNKGRTAEALVALQQAVAIGEPVARARPLDIESQEQLTIAYGSLARAYEFTGAIDQALEVYARRLALAEAMLQSHPTSGKFQLRRITAMSELSQLEGGVGKNAEALALAQKALDAAKTLVRDNPTNKAYQKMLSTAWNGLAATQYFRGGASDALASFDAAGRVLAEIARSDPGDVEVVRDLAGNYFNCGLLNKSLGRPEAAQTDYERSLELRERLAREHPDEPRFTLDVGMVLHDIGEIQRERRQFAQASVSAQHSIDTLENLLKAHPRNAEYRNALARSEEDSGLTAAELGKSDDAVKALRRAHDLCEQTAREQPRVVQYQNDLISTDIDLGATLRKLGRGADAVAVYRGAAKFLAGLPEPSADRLYDLACCHAQLLALANSAGSGLSPKDAPAEGASAVAALRRAVAAGYKDAAHIKQDKDLDSLRGLDDFKKLLADLEQTPAKSR
jgi:serine/threonine protein kinase/tetratricopeptide (TPR) repeat protein